MTPEQKLKGLAYYIDYLIKRDMRPGLLINHRGNIRNWYKTYERTNLSNHINPLTMKKWTF